MHFKNKHCPGRPNWSTKPVFFRATLKTHRQKFWQLTAYMYIQKTILATTWQRIDKIDQLKRRTKGLCMLHWTSSQTDIERLLRLKNLPSHRPKKRFSATWRFTSELTDPCLICAETDWLYETQPRTSAEGQWCRYHNDAPFSKQSVVYGAIKGQSTNDCTKRLEETSLRANFRLVNVAYLASDVY